MSAKPKLNPNAVSFVPSFAFAAAPVALEPATESHDTGADATDVAAIGTGASAADGAAVDTSVGAGAAGSAEAGVFAATANGAAGASVGDAAGDGYAVAAAATGVADAAAQSASTPPAKAAGGFNVAATAFTPSSLGTESPGDDSAAVAAAGTPIGEGDGTEGVQMEFDPADAAAAYNPYAAYGGMPMHYSDGPPAGGALGMTYEQYLAYEEYQANGGTMPYEVYTTPGGLDGIGPASGSMFAATARQFGAKIRYSIDALRAMRPKTPASEPPSDLNLGEITFATSTGGKSGRGGPGASPSWRTRDGGGGVGAKGKGKAGGNSIGSAARDVAKAGSASGSGAGGSATAESGGDSTSEGVPVGGATAWRPRRQQAVPEPEAAERSIRGLLNKLTPDNFDRLAPKFLDVTVTLPETLRRVTDVVFDKACNERGFCDMYAQLCVRLADGLREFVQDDGGGVSFRRLLLERCYSNLLPQDDPATDQLADDADAFGGHVARRYPYEYRVGLEDEDAPLAAERMLRGEGEPASTLNGGSVATTPPRRPAAASGGSVESVGVSEATTPTTSTHTASQLSPASLPAKSGASGDDDSETDSDPGADGDGPSHSSGALADAAEAAAAEAVAAAPAADAGIETPARRGDADSTDSGGDDDVLAPPARSMALRRAGAGSQLAEMASDSSTILGSLVSAKAGDAAGSDGAAVRGHPSGRMSPSAAPELTVPVPASSPGPTSVASSSGLGVHRALWTPSPARTLGGDGTESTVQALTSRRELIGNVVLLGRLFAHGLLTENIVHLCIARFLDVDVSDEAPAPDEDDLEAVCQLFRTIGQALDEASPASHRAVSDYMGVLAEVMDHPLLSSRVRFCIMDVLELRSDGWTEREGQRTMDPKKLAEIRAEVLAEQAVTYGPKRPQLASAKSSPGRGSDKGGFGRHGTHHGSHHTHTHGHSHGHGHGHGHTSASGKRGPGGDRFGVLRHGDPGAAVPLSRVNSSPARVSRR